MVIASASDTRAQAPANCSPTWLPTVGVTPGVNSWVYALESFDDGGGFALYVGGVFTSIGGVSASRVAKWDGSNWSALGEGVDSGMSVGVWALKSFDDGSGPALYAGGRFLTADGGSVDNIARWDGAVWSPLGSGMSGSVMGFTVVRAFAVFDDGSGQALYAAGNFTAAGGTPASCVAKWNGSSWSALAGGVNGAVRALAVFNDGNGPALYVGGKFTSAGGVAAHGIARWDGTSWSPIGSTVHTTVNSLAVLDDGSGPALYVGSDFMQPGGVPANSIARWNGSSWSALGSGVDGSVEAIGSFDSGAGPTLYAAGNFDIAGGSPVTHIAAWNGSSWTPLVSNLNGTVFDLVAHDDGRGSALYVGGAFTESAAGDRYLTRWGCPLSSSGSSYCTAGTTSNGCVPAMASVGAASASAGSGFTISAARVEGQRSGILFYGLSGGQSLAWGAGNSSYLCVKAPAQRLGGAQNSAGTNGACDGLLLADWNTYIASHATALGQPFVGGETVWAQAWFRDPPAPGSRNLSDGLVFLVAP